MPIVATGETARNPFYSFENTKLRSKNVRLIQNFNLNYKPVKFLELDLKIGLDNYNDEFNDFTAYQLNLVTPTNGLGPTNGSLTITNRNQTLTNSIASAFIRTDFEKDFGINIPLTTSTQVAYDYRKNRLYQIAVKGQALLLFLLIPSAWLPKKRAGSPIQNLPHLAGLLISVLIMETCLAYLVVSGRLLISAYGRGSKPFTFPRGDAYLRISELFEKPYRKKNFKIRGAYGEAGLHPNAYDRQVVLVAGSYGTTGYLSTSAGTTNQTLL